MTRERLIATVALVCLGFLAGDRLLLTPMTTKWKERSDRIRELKADLREGRMLVDREEQIKDRWTEMLDTALPDDRPKAEKEVYEAIDDWIIESGLAVNSIKPSWKKGARGEPVERLEVRVSGEGSLREITRFMLELELSSVAVNLESFEITSSDDDGEELRFETTFTGLVFLKRQV